MVCDICHADNVGYYYPDIDKNQKIEVCQAHKEWAEKKGFVVFPHYEYDEEIEEMQEFMREFF